MMKYASDTQKELIHNIQSDKNYRPEEKITTIKSIYESLGVHEITTDRIQHYYNMAIQELTGLFLPAERIQHFLGTIDLLLVRKS